MPVCQRERLLRGAHLYTALPFGIVRDVIAIQTSINLETVETLTTQEIHLHHQKRN